MAKVLIVAARFYDDITDELISGAVQALEKEGAEHELEEVMGALEVPAVFKAAAKKFDAFVALGCVVRGETTHYDYVCQESARGLMDLSIREGLAIGNGILTVENKEQAMKRAGVSDGNKGAFAVQAALRVMELKKKYGG